MQNGLEINLEADDMEKDNIFVIGGQVKGASFIGRKKLLERFKKDFIESNVRKSVSIVGLSKTGKTSFIKKVFENSVPENVFYCFVDVSLCSSYFSIWRQIIDELNDFIIMLPADESKKRLLDLLNKKINSILDDIPDFNNSLKWEMFSGNIIKIFKYLNKLNIKSILVFDEFDSAKNLFSSNSGDSNTLKTQQFALFRTVFSDGDMSVFSITLSRRKIQTIEGGVYFSSSLSGVMELLPFHGFDADDINEFYSILHDKYGYDCSPDEMKQISYYAGNLPYLLFAIAHNIVDMLQNDQCINIHSIFKERCKAINEYYDACTSSFENENYLPKIISIVIGPNVNLTKHDIDDFRNLGYIYQNGSGYLCISEYFTFVHLSDKAREISIWDNIINLEKQLKNLIKIETLNIAETYNINRRVSDVNEIEYAVARYANVYKDILESSKINLRSGTFYQTMSMFITIAIIKGHWDRFFRKYFDDRLYNDFRNRFSKIRIARNGIAHGHEDECITDAARMEIDSYCQEFFELLRKNIGPDVEVPKESSFIL